MFFYLRAMPPVLFSLIKTLRLPNLVIVVLSLAIPYWCVLRPAILQSGGIPALNEKAFVWLALATVLTTLAGYLVNDYFDREIDALNRPDRVLVGKWVHPEFFLAIYLLVLLGSGWSAFQLYKALPWYRTNWPQWVFPVVSLLLMLYAWRFKCTPLTGNFLVAFLCGITPLLVFFPESRPLMLTALDAPDRIREATTVVGWYGLFAFMTTLYREQVKDLEDFQGDATCGCHTLPVQRGVRFGKKAAVLTGIVLALLLGVLLLFWKEQYQQPWRLTAGALLLVAPVILSVLMVLKANEKRDFARSSAVIKWVMLSGTVLLLPFLPDSFTGWKEQWPIWLDHITYFLQQI